MNMMATIEVDAATSCDWRMGEMIWSAVRHGGLLDERDWQPWAIGAQRDISICGGLIAVELPPVDERPAGRWFADPITAVLIARWHREGLTLPAGADAASCLAMFSATRGERVDQLARTSREEWKFRLPGLLLAYAGGDLPVRSVRRSTWERVAYGSAVPDEPVAEVALTTARVAVAPWIADEVAALRFANRAPSYLRGRRAANWKKSNAAEMVEALGMSPDPIRAALQEWAVFALRHEGGRTSKGYSPSTVADYLRALADVLDGLAGCPIRGDARLAADQISASLTACDGGRRAKAVKALHSFLRFANDRRDDPIEVDLDEFMIEQAVVADLVLPEAYKRARMALVGAGEGDAADILTLMFRAGLRLDEAVALRAGDVCIHGDRVELIVEANDERALKTKTSRRILPLDVLLEPAELAGLRERATTRQVCILDDGEAWLFGYDLAVSPPERGPVARQLDRVVSLASGSERIGHTHLRHSFASFLLATLLLPQDVAAPAVPDRLAAVVSPNRFHRVADRLLGEQRLGAGALHAVSQMMGHTGPQTTLRHYCHLLDLSLALHCSRPSAMGIAPSGWVRELLGVGPDAVRKARVRATAPSSAIVSGMKSRAIRPSMSVMTISTPSASQLIAEGHLLAAGAKRLTRNLARTLTAEMLEVELPRRRSTAGRDLQGRGPAGQGKSRRTARHRVPWRHLVAADAALPELPAGIEYARFVDRRLHLSRRPSRDERDALDHVIKHLRSGRTDIRLHRLREAEAFVRLLGLMGFKEGDVRLSLTSIRGAGTASAQIHHFLRDRSAMPQLAGRGGWRGSLAVRLVPQGFEHPILAARAARFALSALHADLITTGHAMGISEPT